MPRETPSTRGGLEERVRRGAGREGGVRALDEYAFDVLGPDLAGAVLEELPVLALGCEGLCWGVLVVEGG